MLVRDVPDNAVLVTDSQELCEVLRHIGVGLDEPIDVGCLFVVVRDGEYEHVWACEHSVSWLDAYVWELL